jgi:hypothetical protein
LSPIVGWSLAALGIAAGYVGWGWPGVVLGVTVVVFWLLLQFSRSLRVLKRAAANPVGHMSDRDGKIWMDGQMVDWRDAKIHVLTHTLHYGCGAFEGVRAYNTVNGTAIFRLQEHTERLFNSAKILRMKIPFTQSRSTKRSAPWCAKTSWRAATCAR